MEDAADPPYEAPFDLASHDLDGTRIVTVSGEIDLNREEELSLALATEGRLYIDMSEVTFIDSTGLNCLLKAKKQSASLQLVRNGAVDRLLELAGLSDHFT